MDDYIKILEVINKNVNISQKQIGELCNFSTGKVNYLINDLMEKKYIFAKKQGRSMKYFLTDKGIEYLENGIATFQDKKIHIHANGQRIIKEAVILAAGETPDFDLPVSLLPLGEETLLDRNIKFLKQNGIKKIVIVTGYKKDYFDFLGNKEGIILVENPRYLWTGSMASLACAKDFITDDFILMEHDTLVEESAIKSLLEDPNRDCILISNESGSGDEAFVEIRNNYIYKISKDVHQLNRIDGEMLGIVKLSYEIFLMMLREFEYNENPLLNYEYLLLDVSRQYNIGYLKINDLVWAEIDDKPHYDHVLNNVYPRLQRKEAAYREDQLKDLMVEALEINKEDVEKIEPFGGMTNKNFKVTINDGRQYVLRIPGTGTEKLINRIHERKNSALASKLGIDANLIYFNEGTGVKISELIPNAETLNPQTAKWEKNMRLTTGVLKKLHTSNIYMENIFDIKEMIFYYESLVDEANGEMYPDYPWLRENVMEILEEFLAMGVPLCPCHNDLVPENLVKSGDDKIYLIDWEYAGMNDPVWDLAAHSLESSFSSKDDELFLSLYFTEGITDEIRTRFMMHKIFQDFIWSLWTVYREAEGDDFGDYGINRHNRAIKNTKLIKEGVFK